MVEINKIGETVDKNQPSSTFHILHFNDVYNIHERDQTSEQDMNKL